MSGQAKQQVLLVDDEPQILVALEDLLSDEFVIFTAQSGKDALELMQEKVDIAVVITDQRMPQMQGDELVARLQALHFAQRILVTGYADLGSVVRAVNDGQIFAYVTKPWNEEDLLMKVTKAAEQFRLSRELAAEKQLLDDLMNNSPDGIYFKDNELKFIRANKTIAGWFGKEVDELVGKKLSDIMASTEEARRIEEQERASLRDKKVIFDFVRQEMIQQRARWFSETKAPVQNLEDARTGIIGISRDITRQRELEQQLVQSQKMEAMGKLAGGVAHDFNNLLLIIQGYGEMLRDEFSEVDLRRDHVEQMLKAVDRAASLTKQLLTFSRKGPARTSLVNINDVVVDVVQMLRRLIPESIELKHELTSEQELVRADATQIEQVVINLVINARDAMPHGGLIVVTTDSSVVGAGPGGGTQKCVRVLVSDNGTGMPPEIRERIFEPFFSTKDVGKGTGLGLSTVYGIVRQWGGEIAVESEVGRGTRFIIDIPISKTQHISVPPQRPLVRPTQGSETVLLVEDDEDVRRITGRILEQDGYTVLSAGSPSLAHKVMSEFQGPIELLLTDVSMPEMDGLSLAKLLTKQRPEMRVLFMSGFVAEELNGAALSRDDCNYIEKPFGPEGLLTIIRNVLTKG